MDYLTQVFMYSRDPTKTQRDKLAETICVLGNGIRLNLKGHMNNLDLPFIITEPVAPFKHLYPFSQEQIILQYAGCSNPGFKEAIQYLIDCIKITPDSVTKEWKDNIHVLEKLRDVPPIVNPYSDKETAETYFKDLLSKPYKNTNGSSDSIRKVTFFDVQWSDCPDFVQQEVKQLWSDYSLGNDYYFYKASLDDKLFECYPRIYYWLKHKGVLEDEEVIVHWWW